MNYCPQCASPMGDVLVDNEIRSGCPDRGCGYVHFNNPVPVVAMIVEVDGGVKVHNAHRFTEAGAHVLVSGSGVFGAEDRGAAIAALKQA